MLEQLRLAVPPPCENGGNGEQLRLAGNHPTKTVDMVKKLWLADTIVKMVEKLRSPLYSRVFL